MARTVEPCAGAENANAQICEEQVKLPFPEPPEEIKAQGVWVARHWLHGYWDGLSGLSAMSISPDHLPQTAYLKGFSAGRDALGTSSMGTKVEKPYCPICEREHEPNLSHLTREDFMTRPFPAFVVSLVPKDDPSATGYITHIDGKPVEDGK